MWLHPLCSIRIFLFSFFILIIVVIFSKFSLRVRLGLALKYCKSAFRIKSFTTNAFICACRVTSIPRFIIVIAITLGNRKIEIIREFQHDNSEGAVGSAILVIVQVQQYWSQLWWWPLGIRWINTILKNCLYNSLQITEQRCLTTDYLWRCERINSKTFFRQDPRSSIIINSDLYKPVSILVGPLVKNA